MDIECEGWWEQDYMGRQQMEPLTLRFSDGEIHGSGSDVVGPFTMTGVLKEGVVKIDKQYIGQHAAKYLGEFDGEGTMQGTWYINGMTGPWLIHLRGPGANAETLEVKEIRPV